MDRRRPQVRFSLYRLLQYLTKHLEHLSIHFTCYSTAHLTSKITVFCVVAITGRAVEWVCFLSTSVLHVGMLPWLPKPSPPGAFHSIGVVSGLLPGQVCCHMGEAPVVGAVFCCLVPCGKVSCDCNGVTVLA